MGAPLAPPITRYRKIPAMRILLAEDETELGTWLVKALGQNDKRFKQLEWLRNALAHGQRSQDTATAKLLSDETALRDALQRFIRDLSR